MTERAPSIWWMNPAYVVVSFSVVLGFAAYLYDEQTYRANWRTPKFFDLHALLVTLACAAVFAIGSLLSSRLMNRIPALTQGVGEDRRSDHKRFLEKLLSISFWLCVAGYGLWIGLAIQRGITMSTVIGIIAGEKGAMYEARFTYLPTVGGITTLTQFGTAAMIVSAILVCRYGWRIVRTKLIVLTGLAFLRALVNSERFALIELFVPFAVVWIAFRLFGSTTLSQRLRGLLHLVPVLGAGTLVVVFTTFEYFRSWTNYYAGRDMTLWEFGATRLLGYYVTSLNNGAYLLNRLDPLNAPYFTLHFLWGFPLTSPLMQRFFSSPLLDTDAKWFYFPFLESEANVEFNNADGQLFPLMDFGISGGLIYWLLLGLICGCLYELYRRRRLLGLLVYPVAYLGLLEMPLALYWGEGRAFPSICLLAIAPLCLWVVRRQVGSRAAITTAGRTREPILLG